jgi:hypothetical protein
MKKLNTGIILNIALIGGLGLVAYKLADFLGIIKSKEQKAAEAAEAALTTGSTANPNILDLKNGSLALTPNYLQTIYKKITADYKAKNKTAPKLSSFIGNYPYTDLVKTMYEAKGMFNDNEDALYGVLNNLQTQLQISFLSNYFFKTYKKDLLSYILSYTNTEERAKIYNTIINKKLY